jgi:hypothetical protein
MATALSAIQNIDTLIDYSVVYQSNKRDGWSFLTGEMKNVKILVKKYDIPEKLKGKNYSNDKQYRKDFKEWIETIWIQKDIDIEKLKF